MFDFHEKRKLKRICYSKAGIFVLLVLVLLFGYQVIDVFQKDQEARDRHREAAAALSELSERRDLLDSEIHRLSSSRGQEEELRDKFDVAKEGERLIVIVDAPADEVDRTDQGERSFLQLFTDLFSF